MNVYCLFEFYTTNYEDHDDLVGVYSTEERALEEIKSQQGCNSTSFFYVNKYVLDAS
jgi:hypothetical protein